MINKQLFELSRVKFELGLFWVFEHDQKYSQVIYHLRKMRLAIYMIYIVDFYNFI